MTNLPEEPRFLCTINTKDHLHQLAAIIRTEAQHLRFLVRYWLNAERIDFLRFLKLIRVDNLEAALDFCYGEQEVSLVPAGHDY
jgi:hypothetical protein